ncbi:hypothetical protein [Bradyrhizobium canariense]|uniref:hypothetical protein n=1 Tax=Bradyrhizobium canariense TaxID=255045 RepID=UPI001FE38031|nr:hypothetical protein [Bradyrhizobium canariense]
MRYLSLKNGLVRIAVAISDFDATQPFDGNLAHFVGSVPPVSSQAADARCDEEISSGPLGSAEELVEVTLASTEMHASTRMIQELLDCLRFSDHRALFFFSMGIRVGLIFLLALPSP